MELLNIKEQEPNPTFIVFEDGIKPWEII